MLAHIDSLGAESIRERLATRLAGHFQLNGMDIDYPGPSIGIAVPHDENESMADLVARADRSMYEEKQTLRRTTAQTHS